MNSKFLYPIVFGSMLALTACGGESSNQQVNKQSVSESAGSPQETLGKIASYHQTPIPQHTAESNHSEMIATNSGLYMSDHRSSKETTILKVEGNPIFSNAWIKATIPGFVWDFVPSNVYSEKSREMSFYFVSTERWGTYSVNSSTPSFDVENDMYISRVVAGGQNGIFTPRPWVIAGGMGNYNRDDQYLYQDDGVYTASKKASDYFAKPASQQYDVSYQSLLLSDPENPKLFVGSCKTIEIYTSEKREKSINLPNDEFSCITQMLWYDGKLWFAYGKNIYRYNDGLSGTLEKVATLQGLVGENTISHYLSGRFCINGGEIFLADGTAIRISDRRKRDWVSTGKLTPSQSVEVAILKGNIGAGIYCSPNNSSGIIYLAVLDDKLTTIFPLKSTN